MRALLPGPVVEPRTRLRHPPASQAGLARAPPQHALGEKLFAAMVRAFEWVFAVACLIVQLLLLAGVMLMVPMLPFLLPLLLAPGVVLLALVIFGAAEVLSLLGLG